MIFSSGYKFTFDEPVVMKALAVYLGVPEDAIILEDSARSTYENASLTARIMERNNWKSALLVSSPYNMFRAYHVFKKSVPGLKIICTAPLVSRFYAIPIPQKSGLFYKRIDARQLSGLMHEFTAIVYYWFRGYI